MLHTKRFVGGLLVAVATISGVVVVDVMVDAIDIVNRAATVAAPARRVAPPKAPVAPDQADAHVMFELINAERAGRGLVTFAWHERVAAAALGHSTDMAAHGSMRHDGSDGSDAGDRLLRAGFAWTAWGENIAAGYPEARSVLAAWMASPGHRRQLLADFTYVGIAVVAASNGTPYWTLDFANGG